jgi:hypothetical protein
MYEVLLLTNSTLLIADMILLRTKKTYTQFMVLSVKNLVFFFTFLGGVRLIALHTSATI